MTILYIKQAWFFLLFKENLSFDTDSVTAHWLAAFPGLEAVTMYVLCNTLAEMPVPHMLSL